jgi:epoxyqueuosine reductase QueG
MSLTEEIKDFVLSQGAIAVGIATTETLAGGPPSADLNYILQGARSAVSFALPLDRDRIRSFLSKKDRLSHEEDNISTNVCATTLSYEIAKMLTNRGYKSEGTLANLSYRTEMPNWQITMAPDISHRYMAVRSGVGSFGWSGNVGIKGFGTAIILGTCVTTAELEPTKPIPEGDGFCDRCRLCVLSCAMERIEKDKEKSVTLGGVTFNHAETKSYLLCDFCCGGFTGLHKSGEWSTWSPGRFRVPNNKEELFEELARASKLYAERPPMPGGIHHPALPDAKFYLTCGNCQLVCWADKKETAKNVKLLHSSGCVLQRSDGSLYVLPADEAAMEFEKMDPAHKRLYH